MNLRELIDELQEALAALESEREAGEVEVLIATQPGWPLAFSIEAITLDSSDPGRKVLWLADGGHPHGRSPYAPPRAWDGGEVSESSEEASS